MGRRVRSGREERRWCGVSIARRRDEWWARTGYLVSYRCGRGERVGKWVERTTGQVSDVPVVDAARERIHVYSRTAPCGCSR